MVEAIVCGNKDGILVTAMLSVVSESEMFENTDVLNKQQRAGYVPGSKMAQLKEVIVSI